MICGVPPFVETSISISGFFVEFCCASIRKSEKLGSFAMEHVVDMAMDAMGAIAFSHLGSAGCPERLSQFIRLISQPSAHLDPFGIYIYI